MWPGAPINSLRDPSTLAFFLAPDRYSTWYLGTFLWTIMEQIKLLLDNPLTEFDSLREDGDHTKGKEVEWGSKAKKQYDQSWSRSLIRSRRVSWLVSENRGGTSCSHSRSSRDKSRSCKRCSRGCHYRSHSRSGSARGGSWRCYDRSCSCSRSAGHHNRRCGSYRACISPAL